MHLRRVLTHSRAVSARQWSHIQPVVVGCGRVPVRWAQSSVEGTKSSAAPANAAPKTPETSSLRKEGPESASSGKSVAKRSGGMRAELPSHLRAELPRPKEVVKGILEGSRKFIKAVLAMGPWVVEALTNAVRLLLRDPRAFWVKVKEMWKHILEELHHMWLGFRLLFEDAGTSARLLSRVATGHALTRRERKLLMRVTTDMFRLVPFSIFIIVPFMEFLLPVALRLFPNMLPSTFQSSLKQEEEQKNMLKARLEMAKFLQEATMEMGTRIANQAEGGSKAQNAKELLGVLERVRNGELLDTEDILRTTTLFQDEMTLDNIGRSQLVVMARFFGINPYVPDALLRFQLRSRIRSLKEDDRQILWEGVDQLSKEELRQACAERGMRATGLTEEGYRRQLTSWLDLSVNKAVPASLLIMSRAFTITSVKEDASRALQQAVSTLDKDVISEAVLEASSEAEGPDRAAVRELRLQSLQYQSQLVQAEREAAEAMQKLRDATDAAERSSRQRVAEAALEEVERAYETASNVAEVSLDDIDLSPEDAEALQVLASERALLRERAALARVKAARMQMEASSMLARGRIGGGATDDSAMDAQHQSSSSSSSVVTNMRSSLDNMLRKLEKELDSTEQKIGSKLSVLDKDRDGVMSASELEDVVKNVLSVANTDEAAAAVVRKIDKDGDGSITLDDIVRYARERAREDAARGRLEELDDLEDDDQDLDKVDQPEQPPPQKQTPRKDSSPPTSSTTPSSTPSSTSKQSTSEQQTTHQKSTPTPATENDDDDDEHLSDSDFSTDDDDEDEAEAEQVLAALRAERSRKAAEDAAAGAAKPKPEDVADSKSERS